MADEENQSTTTTLAAEAVTATAQPVTPPASDKQFTQEDMNRLAAKTREETRQRVLREAKEQPRPEPVKADDGEKLTLKELKAQLDDRDKRADFERKIRKYSLDDEGADDLYVLFKQNPSADADWFDKKAKKFKSEAVQPAPVQPAATATPAQVAANLTATAAAAPSAPSGHGLPTQNGLTNPFALTDDQRSTLGPQGIRKIIEQWASVGDAAAGIPQRPKPPSQR